MISIGVVLSATASSLTASSLVAAAGARDAGARANPEIIQTTTGNIFRAGATPAFVVASAPKGGTWRATDYDGHGAGNGTLDEVPGRQTFRVPVRAGGYYTLTVSTPDGRATTAFAVLPRADRSAPEPFTYGVQTQFSQDWRPGRVAPLIAYAGAETARDAQVWWDIETRKNGRPDYVFPAKYTNYMTRLNKKGISPQIGFGLSSRYHDNECTPYSADGRRAFANFVLAVLRHYAAAHEPIEQIGIYNEPNLPRFGDHKGPPGSGEQCDVPHDGDTDPARARDLAAVVYKAVKRERPGVLVSAPEVSYGLTDFAAKRKWLRRYVALHGLKYLDALSLHPYRAAQPPEDLADDQIRPVRRLMDRGGAAKKNIWITELGWRSDSVGERAQAAYLPRAYVTAMSAGVTRLSWFMFMDSADSLYGLIRSPHADMGPYTPKPSYVEYATMTAQLSGLSYRRAEADSVPGADVQSHVFAGGPAPLRALWTTRKDGARTVRLKSGAPVTVVDGMGRATTHEPVNGEITLRLTGDVQYVHGDVAWPKPGS